MRINASHFIEVVKYTDGKVIDLKPYPINLLDLAFASTKKFGYETIAIFKIIAKHKK